VALSRDGHYILSGTQDETAKLWDVASRHEIRTFAGFDFLGPCSVAFDADGTHMIIGDLDGISVVETATGNRLRRLGGINMNPASLVSGDGRTGVDNVGVGAASRSPRVVDLVTGQVIWTVPVENGAEAAVAFSPDGRTLLTRMVGRTRPGFFSRQAPDLSFELHVWDVPAHKLRGKIPWRTTWARAETPSSSAPTALSCSPKRATDLWRSPIWRRARYY
jgi:WD40 repeat protein